MTKGTTKITSSYEVNVIISVPYWACLHVKVILLYAPLVSRTFGFDRIDNSIGSLRNDEGEAVDNVGLNMNLYFTYESRDALKLFSLFLAVKTISKLNMEHSIKLEKEI